MIKEVRAEKVDGKWKITVKRDEGDSISNMTPDDSIKSLKHAMETMIEPEAK